jgi:hypothetical protein
MLTKVAQLAERTKVLAGTALEALDAPDSDHEDNHIDPDIAAVTGFPSAPPTPSPGLEKSIPAEPLLIRLIEGLTGQRAINPAETAEVLTTQLTLLRENSIGLGLTDQSGSLINLLNHLIEERAVPGGSETAQSLLEALEREQSENQRLRDLLAKESRRSSQSSLGDEVESLKQQLHVLTTEKESAELETKRMQRMLAKVVKEKAELELEKDNEDKIDARIMRSAFTTLCAQIDNKSVRDGVLMVMAEMLQISHEDRVQFNVPSNSRRESMDESAKKRGLADEFMNFLAQELDGEGVIDPPTSPV